MNSPRHFRFLFAGLVLGGLLVLPSCNDYNMDDTSDFGQKALQKHFQNGEMNNYQYQSNVKVFQQPGATPAPASASGTGNPTPPAASSTPSPAPAP